MLIFPLCVVLAANAAVAALLCAPVRPLTRLGLLITGVLRQQVVSIICATWAGILLLILLFSAFRMKHLVGVMRQAVSTSGAATVFLEARQEMYMEGIQACLAASALVVGMTVIRLDEMLRKNKSLQSNLDTMVKQAKGTQQEYMRQLAEQQQQQAKEGKEGGSGQGVTPSPAQSADASALKRENSYLKEENERLQRDMRAADASVSAIKKQTEGLQLEFSRVLEENESLRSQLSIFDRKYAKSEDKKLK